ncbi:thiamine pyrophosphate-dependent enzyme [Arthrobacter castelli]|uniref:thiamine pyrophosphate-dependent enzyme n=1 Tax=Arthrobacter castelli TaxID=271431 RepID=UPI000409C6CF
MPKDVLDAKVEEPETAARPAKLGEYPLDRSRPDGQRVAEAAHLLANAKAPLIVAGGGVHLSGAAEEVARLQELAGIPVATTNMGKGSVAETHELSLGVIGNALGKNLPNRQVRKLVDDADVIFFVGTRTNENGTGSWSLFPAGATYVHFDVDGGEVGRNYPAHRLVGDAKLGLQDITAELEKADLSPRVAARDDAARQITTAKETAAAEAAERISAPAGEKITPQQAMAVLDRHLGEDDIAVADASYSTLWMTGYLTAKKTGQRFISPRGLAGLGWGLPLAMGSQTANPDKRVVCISGDGGYGHVWAEMEAAVRNRQPIVSIVLNNSILGFQKHAEIAQFSQYTSAISFASVDHSAIARAVGAQADTVTNVDELEDALKRARDGSSFHLIEVITEADAYPPIAVWDDTDPEKFFG